jgi:hypothetical protein
MVRILGLLTILLAVLIVVVPWVVDSPGWFSQLGIFAILLATLIATAPWIVARTGLRNRAINAAMASPSVTASSDGASLGWFSPPSVRGLRLCSTNHHVEIRVDTVAMERSPYQLWCSAPDLGTIRAEKPHVILEWPLAVQLREQRFWLEPTFTAIVKDAALTIRLTGQDAPVIDVDGIDLTFRVEPGEDGRVLTLDPVVIFNRRKLTPRLACGLLQLLDPMMSDTTDISGEITLSLDKVHIPIGVPRGDAVRHMEVEGKLVLHEVSARVANPMWQTLVRLVADMNGKDAPEVVSVAQNEEIRFRVRDGRVYHEGLRAGFPDIDPGLVLTSRGSVGLDRSVDLFVDLPRLDREQWKGKGPARCRVTGTIGNPRIAVEDGTLALRQPGRKEPFIATDGINLSTRVESTPAGRVLAVDPVEVFRNTKLNFAVAAGLVRLLAPDVLTDRVVTGEVSLSFDKLRVPLGAPDEQALKRLEAEGVLRLHQFAAEVKSPAWQALVRLLADMNGKSAPDVIRLVEESEIRFRVRDGRVYHEGHKVGFPDIAPGLMVTSRGSIGIDETVDLFVELPRLDPELRKEKGPARCHITGTLGNPRIAVEDGTLTLRQPGRMDPIFAADGIDLTVQVEDTGTGRVLVVEPVEVFRRTKLSLAVASGLLRLLAPDVADPEREVAGEVSLSLSRLRLPLGAAGDQRLQHLEADGRLTLHRVASDVKSPMWQALIAVVADMNSAPTPDPIRLVADAEVQFRVRAGRLHYEGLRVGFPDIDPELVVSSRGSVGLDGTLDLFVDLPRLLRTRRNRPPLQCHVTGTIREPVISLPNSPLLIGHGMARCITSAYAWACRTPLLIGPFTRATRWALIGLRRVADLPAVLFPSKTAARGPQWERITDPRVS